MLISVPGVSDAKRYRTGRALALRLLDQGDTDSAERVARRTAPRLSDARLRADLLGDVTSRILAEGRQPALAVDTYGAELAVADQHLAAGRLEAAAASFEEAMRTAFHRVLHFDHATSPLATAPAAFTAPLRSSTTAVALSAPRRPVRPVVPARVHDRPTRLLLSTYRNADFLAEIRDHFADHSDFETRFVDFAEDHRLDRLAKNPGALAEAVLRGDESTMAGLDAVFRAHLESADVMFVEWCLALAALLSRVDPGNTRIVVRMHSYEAFTQWPQLTDVSRVDDLVFVSEHLRDLAVAAIPALSGPHAPRLHVITNAMNLPRFVRLKPDSARFTLGVVGASKVVKDPRWAIAVLRELRKHDDRYRLVLLRGRLQDRSAATRDYADALHRDVAQLTAAGALEVRGHTDDVPAALTDIGVVVSSSVRESFHIGLVEGAASGAVPVVRDWPFFPGSARRLFPESWVVANPTEAADRILAATATEQSWRQAGEEAAAHVLERWDWEVVKGQYDALLGTQPAVAGLSSTSE